MSSSSTRFASSGPDPAQTLPHYSTPTRTARRASSALSPHDRLLQQQSPANRKKVMARRISQGQIRLPDIKEDELGIERTLLIGKADHSRCDNQLITSKYTVWNFFPLVSNYAITRQYKIQMHEMEWNW